MEKNYGPWVLQHRKTGKETMERIASSFGPMYDMGLTELTNGQIEAWRTKRLKAGAKSSTVNRDIASLRSAVAKAVEWEIIGEHPFAKVKPLQIDPNPIVRFLSIDEEKRLRLALDTRQDKHRATRDSANHWRKERGKAPLPDLKSLEFTDHLKPMILISINTGIRQGELFNLTWRQVDFERANLTVHGYGAKSGRTRHIPMNAEALKTLTDWKAQSTGSGLVFPNKNGSPFDNVGNSWTKLLLDASIENFRWHDLRHHFASRLVMAGVDLNTVRELLGHSDIKMTLRYAHLAPEHKAAAVAKLISSNA